MTLSLLLYIIALILLVLAALGVSPPRVSLLALGLALWLFTAAILPSLT
jgi:hypothetical protein